ncbi:MAG: efflux RND transporter periplasmic adaptor subunit [Verrucomicrobiota bacterium]
MTKPPPCSQKRAAILRWTPRVLILLAIFATGYWLGTGAFAPTESPSAETKTPTHDHESEETVWTCSMHPQIRQSEPGSCPICGMDLIPLEDEEASTDIGPRQLLLSDTARKLAEVQTFPAERRAVDREIRMVGKIDFDETRTETISAWVPGRLDRLFVDYTGVPVKKGDHMVSLYSPEILTAQEELIQAVETVRSLEESDVGIVRETAQATIRAAREKLRLWGLTEKQIDRIQASGTPSDHITIYAPAGGIVVHKNAVEGMYVQTGSRIYTIADLSQLWVKLDAYESDLQWLRYGQKVTFTVEAYPGETFNGRIAFIDPVLTEKTRTFKVRVNVKNEDGRLKPDMFVRAGVHAKLAGASKVVSEHLADKWICPMHPSEIDDSPGACSICEMPLVSSESLGYVEPEDKTVELPLVIPASAPLLTGKRAVVYLKVPNREGVFEGREIELGPRTGDRYIVQSGLKEGELVVTHGNFKIDSAMQIVAKPSMMSPAEKPAAKSATAEEDNESIPVPQKFTRQLAPVFEQYLRIQKALVADEEEPAKKAAETLLANLANVDMDLLEHDAHMRWMKQHPDIKTSAENLSEADDLPQARAVFAQLSESLTAVARTFGTGIDKSLRLMHCPMAFNNRGANWLQTKTDLENPYYGEAMLRCGELKETLEVHDK